LLRSSSGPDQTYLGFGGQTTAYLGESGAPSRVVARSFSDIETMTDETANATTIIRHSAAELVAHTSSIQQRIVSFTEQVRAAQA
jgi:hypothetical protein